MDIFRTEQHDRRLSTPPASRSISPGIGFGHGLRASLKVRFTGPGGLYNIGNVIALGAGMAVSLAQTQGTDSLADAARAYLFGSPAASWLTLSLLVFILSGELYHRAFAADAPRLGLVRAGDFVSAASAMALAISLMHLGDVMLAIVAGALLGGGKLGSALSPGGNWIVAIETGVDRPTAKRISFDGFRIAVILSRIPTLVLLASETLRIATSETPLTTAILPAIMIGCFLIWLRADILLMSDENVK